MDPSLVWLPAVVALAAITVGGTLQRVSGMGVGMIAAPTLSLLLGPVAGVTLSNVAAVLGLQQRFTAQGNGAVFASGAVAGFMNTTAGIAGPALAVYAVASRWDQRSWAATLQPVFLLANLTSLVTKSLFGAAVPAGLHVPWPVWVAVVAGGPLGVLLGSVVARRVDPAKARVLAICLAGVGGTVALVRGVAGTLG